MKKGQSTVLKTSSNQSYFKMLFRMFLIFQVVLLVANVIIFLFIKNALAEDVKVYNTNVINSIISSVSDTFLEMTKVCASGRLTAQKVNESHNVKNLEPVDYINLGELRKDFVNLFSIRRSYDKWFYYNTEKGIIMDTSGIYNAEEYLQYYYKYAGIKVQDFERLVITPVKRAQILPVSIFYERQLTGTLSERVVPFIYSYQESLSQKSILVINYSLKNLDRITSGYLTSEQMSIVVTDENGNILSLVGNLGEEGRAHLSQKQLQEDRLYLEEERFDGKKYVVMSHKIEFPNWTIHISLPNSIFYQKLNMIFFLLLLANLSIALVGIGLAYGFSKRLFSPIYNLFSVLYPQKAASRYPFNQNEIQLIRSRLEEIKQNNSNLTNDMRHMRPMVVNAFLKNALEQKDFLRDKDKVQFFEDNTAFSMGQDIYLCDVRFIFHPSFIEQLSTTEKKRMPANLYSLFLSMLSVSIDRVICVDFGLGHMVFLMQDVSKQVDSKVRSAVEDLRNLFIFDTDNIRISFITGRLSDVSAMGQVYFTMCQQYREIPFSLLSSKVWTVNETPRERAFLTLNWEKLDNIIKAGESIKVENFIEQQIMSLDGELTIKSMEVFYRKYYQICSDIIQTENWKCPDFNLLEEIDVSRFFSIEEFIVRLKQVALLLCSCSTEQESSRREDLIKYIKAHFAEENLSLESMAEDFHVSPNHLSRVFKEQIGISFTDYLASYRIGQAKILLLTTKGTINDIAAMVGISSRVTFNRLFNKLEGVSPGKYRTIYNDITDN